MGFPSYAQPIIGEWSVEATSWLLTLFKSLAPYKVFPSKSVPNTASLNFLGAYKWAYWSPLSILNWSAIIPSSVLKLSICLWNKFNLQFWISALNSAPSPGTRVVILVFSCVYFSPPSITLTDVIVLSVRTGVSTAPTPSPSINKSGGELKLVPVAKTNTSIIFPSLTIGFNWAPEPAIKVISGCLSKLIISDDPYPTPFLDTWTELILPLIIGWTWSWKVLVPIEEIPTFPVIFTVISG